MYSPVFELDSFEDLPEIAQCAMMRTLTEALKGVDKAFLMLKRVPRLYTSGVRYGAPRGNGSRQVWRDIPRILRDGQATCMELCAWRAAELELLDGYPHVTPIVTCRWMTGPGGARGLMFHVRISADGGKSIEDPSANLGMGNDEWLPFS